MQQLKSAQNVTATKPWCVVLLCISIRDSKFLSAVYGLISKLHSPSPTSIHPAHRISHIVIIWNPICSSLASFPHP